MPPEHAQRVESVAPEQVEMLARGAAQQVGEGPQPQPAEAARAAEGVEPLIVEVRRHLVAKVPAEVRREQLQQRAKQAIVEGRASHRRVTR